MCKLYLRMLTGLAALAVAGASSAAAIAPGVSADAPASAAAASAMATAARPGAPPPAHAHGRAQAQGRSFLAELPPVSLGSGCLPSGNGFLRARIRGAVRVDVDLRGARLTCEGGPRFDGSGVRMGFEGRAGAAGRIRMIFGIDGAKEARAGRELPTNLTVIFEDRKLLFATQGHGNCTVDRLTQEPLGKGHRPTRSAHAAAKTQARPATSTAPAATARDAPAREYRVVAHGFCIAPANDLSGRRRILVTTFDFAGRADFDTP
jgi:hypothetical protein